MSFPDARPPFIQSMTPFSGNGEGHDGGGFWSQEFDPHSQIEQQHHPPFKRSRNSEENQSNLMPYPSMNTRGNIPYPPPVNRGSNNIFFKTRMCVKFKSGMCRNGENCNFAHGIDDIRHPPANWQELVSGREEDRPVGNWEEDQKIIHRMKLCKNYYNGEECPFGIDCNYRHEDPGRFRESSVISIGTIGSPVVNGCGSNNSDGNRVVNSGSDASRLNLKPVYWKTKLCTKWEMTGQCPFGDKCHFAHGKAELQVNCGRIEGEGANTGSSLTKSHFVPAIDASSSIVASGPTSIEYAQGRKCLLNLSTRKINRIYADWLDDLPLTHNPSSTPDS